MTNYCAIYCYYSDLPEIFYILLFFILLLTNIIDDLISILMVVKNEVLVIWSIIERKLSMQYNSINVIVMIYYWYWWYYWRSDITIIFNGEVWSDIFNNV